MATRTKRKRDERPEIPMDALRLPDAEESLTVEETRQLFRKVGGLPERACLLPAERLNLLRIFTTLFHYQTMLVNYGVDPDFGLPLRIRRNGIHYLYERRCRVCNCSDLQACPGGCYWVEEDLCSQCAGKAKEQEI